MVLYGNQDHATRAAWLPPLHQLHHLYPQIKGMKAQIEKTSTKTLDGLQI
jgi:hypothetical protein